MTLRMKAEGDSRAADLDEVRRALSILADPDGGIQLSTAPFNGKDWKSFAGSDVDGMVAWVRANAGLIGTYYCLNPVPADLNRIITSALALRRRWLLIDVDRCKAERPDDSATDAEHARAMVMMARIRAFLDARQWPPAVVIDSGNGYHLLYRVNLPNVPESQKLIREFLHALAAKFDGPDGDVGSECHDAKRISKLPGTWARRGVESSDRPYRMARLIEVSAFAGTDDEIVHEDAIRATTDALKPSQASIETVVETPREMGAGQRKNGMVIVAPTPLTPEDRAASYLAKIPGAVSGQGGHNALFNAARAVVYGFNLDVDAGFRLLLRDYNPRCLPPWSEKDIRHKCEEADTVAYDKPRGWLLEDDATRRTESNGTQNRKAEGANRSQQPGPGWVKGDSIVYPASDVQVRNVEWLWNNRIPLGKLTTFAGVGGLGKTFVLLSVAATVSRGLAWPDSEGECTQAGDVLFLSGEDEPEDTLVPRLVKMNADLNRVFFLKTEVQDRFTLADLPTLDEALRQAGNKVRYVAIDPPTAFLGGVNDHKNAELRGLLSPLKSWANNHGCAIVFNTHFTKPQGQKVEAMMRVMGSVAWVNAVRAAHMFAKDPEDVEKKRRFFIPMKNNLGPEQKGLAYKLAYEPGQMATVEWMGVIETSADDAVNGKEKKNNETDAVQLIMDLFKDKKELDSSVIWAAAKDARISTYAINAAKKELNIRAVKTYFLGKHHWIWKLPEVSQGEEVDI